MKHTPIMQYKQSDDAYVELGIKLAASLLMLLLIISFIL